MPPKNLPTNLPGSDNNNGDVPAGFPLNAFSMEDGARDPQEELWELEKIKEGEAGEIEIDTNTERQRGGTNGENEDESTKEKKWDSTRIITVLGMLFIFALIAWYLIGSGTSPDSNDKTEQNQDPPNAQQSESEMFSSSPSSSRTEVPITPKEMELSLYAGWVKLSRGSAKEEIYPQKEYVIVTVAQRNLSSINISQWRLRNSFGRSAALGSGTELYLHGTQTVSPIRVFGGEKIIISSGSSPVGISFKVNKCSGYLEQFLDFVPEIRTQCPKPRYDKNYLSMERACRNFINTIPPCEANVREFPDDTSFACRTYIYNTIHYNACASTYRNDPYFYSSNKEWRVYLNQGYEMWDNTHDTIMLLDTEGKLIDSIEY